MPEPKTIRPGSLPARAPKTPPVESEHESERPPSDSAISLLADALLAGDRELFLDRLQAYDRRHATEVAALRKTVTDQSGEISELKNTIAQKDVDLATRRMQEEIADKARDGRLEGLEDWRIAAEPYIRVLSKATAPQVAVLNKPDTEATATAATATALNKARYHDYAWKAFIGILVTILGLLQAMNAKKGEPTATVPVPTVKQANPNNPGGMPDPR